VFSLGKVRHMHSAIAKAPAGSISLDDCWFYHSIDLPSLGPVEGQWDLRSRFSEYTGGVDFRGKTVLDVGTASGFLSFEAERAGAAAVYGFDADSVERYTLKPGASPDAETFRKMRNGYWLAHRQFGSRTRPIFGDILSLSRLVPPCDIVILGQLLVHTRDPLGVIEQAALVCREHLIVADGIYRSDQPVAKYVGAGHKATMNWWALSIPLYEQFLDALDFDLSRAEMGTYWCNALKKDIGVWTIVARRR
jgi:SAM-dependent methyltransferase